MNMNMIMAAVAALMLGGCSIVSWDYTDPCYDADAKPWECRGDNGNGTESAPAAEPEPSPEPQSEPEPEDKGEQDVY